MEKGELELIRRIQRSAARHGRGAGGLVKLAIGDDCAVLRPPRGRELLVTTDLTLENAHFRRAWHPAESVGHRCLARGVSDIAAMGGRPEAAFLSIAVPAELREDWLDRFLEGWMAAANRYGVTLAGGDTAEAPRCTRGKQCALFTADVVLLGSAPAGKALRRSGARAGDLLYVTGELGGAAAELHALAANPAAYKKRDAERHAHLFPEPRLKIGTRLVAARLAGAAIDLSDGLSTDLSHICEASNLDAFINQDSLPIARGAALDDALHGGEDYELLFTARPRIRIPAKLAGVPVRRIGGMIERRRIPGRRNSRIELRTASGRRMPLRAGGWEHFRKQGTQRLEN